MHVPDLYIVGVHCHHPFPFRKAEKTHKCEGGHGEAKAVKKEPRYQNALTSIVCHVLATFAKYGRAEHH
jgi:hypothetical protein